jgi:nucleoside-diphosphate-sugar epimerase
MKIAVFGASGLVGATLTERLLAKGEHEIVPIIHTAGNAWRLARLGIDLTQADVTNREDVLRAVDGCTHVINCALGSNQALVTGIRNLLAACATQPIERMVHLSSVLVYGEPPSPESEFEDASPIVEKGSYQDFKLRQDVLVEEACDQGVKAVNLCIPNVSGIYSRYVLDIVASLRAGTFALVDDGCAPVVLGDVANIAHALELGLHSDEADGKRIFINDGGQGTWGDVARLLSPLAGRTDPIPTISREEAENIVSGGGSGGVKAHLGTLRKIAGLELVKNVVKQNPDLSREFRSLRARYEGLPGWAAKPLASLLKGGGGGATASGPRPNYEVRFLQHQLRGVRHRIDKAQRVLGYEPPYDLEASMGAFSAWYQTIQGHGEPGWELFEELLR